MADNAVPPNDPIVEVEEAEQQEEAAAAAASEAAAVPVAAQPEQQIQLTCSLSELLQVARPEPTTRQIQPPSHDPTLDIREYLALFQQVVQHNRWTDLEAGLQLRCALRGQAQVTAHSMPAAGFTTLYEELADRYALSELEARLRLQNLTRVKGMPAQALADEIHRLVRVGYGTDSSESQLKQKELEAFVNILDKPDVAMHIYTGRVTGLRQAVEVVNVHENYRRRQALHRGGAHVRSLQTPEAEGTQPAEMLRAITQLTAARCFHCGESHYMKDCPLLKQEAAPKKSQNPKNKKPRKPSEPAPAQGNE